jgi:hypothetical protein
MIGRKLGWTLMGVVLEHRETDPMIRSAFMLRMGGGLNGRRVEGQSGVAQERARALTTRCAERQGLL